MPQELLAGLQQLTAGMWVCRYQSTVLGSFQTIELIDTFVNYAESIKQCICLVYDPQQYASGGLALRAIKLRDRFMKVRYSAHRVVAFAHVVWSTPSLYGAPMHALMGYRVW